jgi:hypothetical protein
MLCNIRKNETFCLVPGDSGVEEVSGCKVRVKRKKMNIQCSMLNLENVWLRNAGYGLRGAGKKKTKKIDNIQCSIFNLENVWVRVMSCRVQGAD